MAFYLFLGLEFVVLGFAIYLHLIMMLEDRRAKERKEKRCSY